MCIFAEEKMFKSVLTQYTAFCLATGHRWLGLNVTPVNRIMYLQTEIPKANFQIRERKMIDYLMRQNLGPNVVASSLNSISVASDFRFKIDIPDHFERLKRDIRAMGTPYPEVLILDPWYRIMTSEDPKTYGVCQDRFDELIDEFGCSLIIVHHTNKPSYNWQGRINRPDRPRGPLTVAGYFDSLVQILGDVQKNDRICRFVLRNAEEDQDDIFFRLNKANLWFEVI